MSASCVPRGLAQFAIATSLFLLGLLLLLLLQYLLRQLAVPPEDVERIFKQQTLLLQPGGLQRLRTTVAFLHGKLLTQEEVAHVISRVPKVCGAAMRFSELLYLRGCRTS